MEFNRSDRVVNVRTGQFAVYEASQQVVTASGETYVLYQVQPDQEGVPRQAWRAEDIAPWAKAAKATGINPQPPSSH